MLGELLPQSRDVLVALVLLDQEVLEPLVLRLELRYLGLEGVDLVGHLLGGLLKSLLTLLLLDTEASAGGSVASALVLFGSDTGYILKGHGLGRWSRHGVALALVAGSGSTSVILGVSMGVSRSVVRLERLVVVVGIGVVVHWGRSITIIELREVELVCGASQSV